VVLADLWDATVQFKPRDVVAWHDGTLTVKDKQQITLEIVMGIPEHESQIASTEVSRRYRREMQREVSRMEDAGVMVDFVILGDF
jgi:hypothetical protein